MTDEEKEAAKRRVEKESHAFRLEVKKRYPVHFFLGAPKSAENIPGEGIAHFLGGDEHEVGLMFVKLFRDRPELKKMVSHAAAYVEFSAEVKKREKEKKGFNYKIKVKDKDAQ